jgi:hydroxyethylthiazole kinase-like uncharacterized protein yjeF
MEYLPEALYDAAVVREADRRANALAAQGSGALMERAGEVAFHLLRERFPRARRLVVVCGPGNNGGDGYVLARLARTAGLAVRVLAVAETDRLQGDARAAWQRWQAAGGESRSFTATDLNDADVIVDALFGTGLERPLQGSWGETANAINASGRPVLALDIPSGLHADTGRVLGVAIRASVTVSFIGLKTGLFTAQGREHSGLILFDDLGVPASVFDGLMPRARRLTARTLRGLLTPRRRHAHKGDAGRLLVIGGQSGMPGAVRLAGEAAYRAGAGLVVVATHPGHAAAVSSACPELISYGCESPDELLDLIRPADVLALGPGLGQDDWSKRLWQAAIAAPQPIVMDADALNLLATATHRRHDWVLTPHPGEAARLLGTSVADIEHDRLTAVRTIVDRFGGVCVLKGNGSLVAADQAADLWLCDRGNPGLAVAGTGDVLTGVIAALLAQGLKPLDAARLGVWAHASAGDQAAEDGERGMRASDLMRPVRATLNALMLDAH